MTGQQKPVNKSFNIAGYDGNKDLADILNTFYLRFDTEDFADVYSSVMYSFCTILQVKHEFKSV